MVVLPEIIRSCLNYYKKRAKNNLLIINKKAPQHCAELGEFDQDLAKKLTLIRDQL